MTWLLAHPYLLSSAIFAALWLCLELGRWLGHRRAGAGGDSAAVDGAIFALLGLLIAFTFSGAVSRFDQRRELIVTEANAIGTAWLRIDLAPADAQPELRALFRRYIASRRAAYAAVADADGFEVALQRSNAIQSEIWSAAIAAGRRPDALPAANMLLLPALNDMIDITTTRALAMKMHPPLVIYAMLLALALIGAILAGYAMGKSDASGGDRRPWLHPLSFAAIMTLAIYVIVDIEYPRFGFIRVDSFETDAFDFALPR